MAIKTRPSKLEADRLCPAKLQVEPQYPDEQSAYAAEGQVAHWVLEQVQLGHGEPVDYIGTTCPEHPDLEITREMVQAVDQALAYINDLILTGQVLERGVEADVEVSAALGNVCNDGRTDLYILLQVDDEITLHVLDYKHGQGVVVDADGDQGKAYSAGLMERLDLYYDIDKVVIHIMQPRAGNWSTHTMSVMQLTEWATRVKEELGRLGLLDASGEELPFNPNEKSCKFCKARFDCKARHDSVMEAAFGGVTDETPAWQISADELARAYAKVKEVKAWASDVEQAALARLEEGHGLPGYKLVAGRANRMWVDEDKATRKLRYLGLKSEDFTVKKLITPAQAEKLLDKDGRQKLANVIEKPPGKPTIAPESDRRPAITTDTDEAFAGIDSQAA